MAGCHDALQCLDEARTVATLTSLAGEGLPTYVIGLESVVDNQFVTALNAMAVAGGRPRVGGSDSFYAATSDADLDSAIAAIRDQVGACVYLTSSVPNADGTIEVTLDGTPIAYDPTSTNGWSWGDRTNGEIVVFGNACTLVGSAASPDVAAEVTCGGPDAGLDGGIDSVADAGRGGS
jgi:hypothetical protein